MADEPDELYAAMAFVIMHWRLSAKLSREDVYAAARLSKSTYIRLEEGNNGVVTGRQMKAIAGVYDRKGSQLFTEAESLLDSGQLPNVPRTVRAWHLRFG